MKKKINKNYNNLIKIIFKNKNLIIIYLMEKVFKYNFKTSSGGFNKYNSQYKFNLLNKINIFTNLHFKNNNKFLNSSGAYNFLFTNVFNDVCSILNNRLNKENQSKIFFKNAI